MAKTPPEPRGQKKPAPKSRRSAAKARTVKNVAVTNPQHRAAFAALLAAAAAREDSES